MKRQLPVLLTGIVLLSCLAGCGSGGPTLYGVSGVVMLDDVEIKQGSITFVPAAGTEGPSGGAEIVNGAYKIPPEKGLAAGKYKVEVRSQKKTGKKIEVGSPTPPGTMMDETVEAVAPKFNTESKLETEITGNQESLDFDVSSK